MMFVLYPVFYNIFKATQNNSVLPLPIGIASWRFLANGTLSANRIHCLKAKALVTKVHVPRQVLVLECSSC
jgi:ABC-type polysaccharide/polyol phosphate export permease